jgi:hypothetical protein
MHILLKFLILKLLPFSGAEGGGPLQPLLVNIHYDDVVPNRNSFPVKWNGNQLDANPENSAPGQNNVGNISLIIENNILNISQLLSLDIFYRFSQHFIGPVHPLRLHLARLSISLLIRELIWLRALPRRFLTWYLTARLGISLSDQQQNTRK